MFARPIILALAALALLPPPSAAGTPDPAAIRAGIDTLLTDPKAFDPLAALLDLPAAPVLTGLPETPPFPEGPDPVVASGKLQLGLSQLAIHAGTNGHIALVRAQNGQSDAIFLQSGFTDLATLARAATDQGIAGITVEGQTVTLTRPLVVWMGAGLHLDPGDTLRLSGTDGAFLLNFGRLDSESATVETTGDSEFRPFLLTAGQGTLRLEGSTLDGLGFSRSDTFGGIAVLSRGLFRPDHPPLVRNSTFTDTGLLFLAGSDGAWIEGNTFLSPRTGGLTLSATKAATVTGNLIHAAQGSAALRLRDGAEDTRIAGNLILNSLRTGVMGEGNLTRITLAGNAIAGSGGVGLLLRRADCLRLSGNLIAANGAAGIKMVETARATLARNAILHNSGSGLTIQTQPPEARTDLSANLLMSNRDGLSGAGLGPVTLAGDDLTGQLPRLFSGEFAQYLPAYLSARDAQGETGFATATPAGTASETAPCP